MDSTPYSFNRTDNSSFHAFIPCLDFGHVKFTMEKLTESENVPTILGNRLCQTKPISLSLSLSLPLSLSIYMF